MRLLLILVLLLVAFPALAEPAYVDPKTGFVFPERVNTFVFDAKRKYNHPSLGYGLNYRDMTGTLITVIVYDLGIEKIPNGIKGKILKEQMAKARGDVQKAVDYGYYASIKVISVPDAFSRYFLKASYIITKKDGTKRRSHIFLRGQNKRFIKIRATGANNKKIDPSISRFVDRIAESVVSKNNSK